MRIGTWNLQGRWDQRHLDQLTAMRCDIVLLTEVSDRVQIPGTNLHTTEGLMAPRRHWAAIASGRPIYALADPHGASAMAEIDGRRVCSSILPWKACGARSPWTGSTTAEKTESAVECVEASVPEIWGGDWNHAMFGREWTGSVKGRQTITAAVDRLGLQVATTSAPHQIPSLLSIDHVAVPTTWNVLTVERHRAFVGEVKISDHDAYVVEVEGA